MHSRILTTKQALSTTVNFLFWTPLMLLSLLLIYNTLPYFTFSPHLSFLEERAVLYAKLVWRVSFYLHIAAGALCLGTALIQFSGWILKRRKYIHIISGKIYVFVVLLIGAPSGFYMTFFAKGGFWERACFMAMALFWFFTTYKGFVTVARDRNFLAHKFWMIRSYAMALTAVTFRVYHILFYLGGMNDFTNYAVSLWISVIGNAAFAEALIYFKSRNYLKTLTA